MSKLGVTMSSDELAPPISTLRSGGMNDWLAFSVSPRLSSTAYQRSESGSSWSVYWPGVISVAWRALGPPLIGLPLGSYWRSARVVSARSSSRRLSASVASR